MTIDEKLKELRSDMADNLTAAKHYKSARKVALDRAEQLRKRILDIEDIRNQLDCPNCLGRVTPDGFEFTPKA